MKREDKIVSTVKINVVERYLKGQLSINEVSSIIKVSYASVEDWVIKYRTFGPEGLIYKRRNKDYCR